MSFELTLRSSQSSRKGRVFQAEEQHRLGWSHMEMPSLLVEKGAGPGRWCKGWYRSGRGGQSAAWVTGKSWVGPSDFP